MATLREWTINLSHTISHLTSHHQLQQLLKSQLQVTKRLQLSSITNTKKLLRTSKRKSRKKRRKRRRRPTKKPRKRKRRKPTKRRRRFHPRKKFLNLQSLSRPRPRKLKRPQLLMLRKFQLITLTNMIKHPSPQAK